MIKAPPREKEFISWLYVMIFSLLVFGTVPFARETTRLISSRLGENFFMYFVVGAVTVALVSVLSYIGRRNSRIGVNFIWLWAVAIIFIGYTIRLREIPVEAVHFLEYGFLGILLYRAFSHRIHDYTIYFAVTIAGGIIGMVDETVQWITPGRYWEAGDIWINITAVSLVQAGIAKGLRPSFISGPPGYANLAMICRLALVAVLFFGACLFNTYERIVWYTDRIPFLAFLEKNENAMLEYGYLYSDPEIGVFRSRLSPEELKETDRRRAKEAAAVLDRFRDRDGYMEFLKIYTFAVDPFLHEVRVHLFRRDRYYANALKKESDKDDYKMNLTVAFRENQILEKYFPQTLDQSSYKWTEEMFVRARKNYIAETDYESPVSGNLITRFSEFQIGVILVTLVGCLFCLQFYFAYLSKKARK